MNAVQDLGVVPYIYNALTGREVGVEAQRRRVQRQRQRGATRGRRQRVQRAAARHARVLAQRRRHLPHLSISKDGNPFFVY